MSTQALDFRQAKILVAGDVMIDQYWLGDASRISPEAPVPVVKIEGDDFRLGGAANAALNCASLGSQVSLAGIIGHDDDGEMYQTLLAENNIQSLHASCKEASTIKKLRIISRSQQVLRADFEAPFSVAAQQQVTDNILGAVAQQDVILLSDYAKGCLIDCPRIIQQANAANVPVIIDPKGDDYSKYTGAFLLTPNMQEFELVVGTCADEQDLFQKAQQLIDALSLQALLLTRSEKGMTLFLQDGKHHHFNAEAKEVFDVTGAGDTVIATLASAMAAEHAISDAATLANTAASVVVGKMGTVAITPLDLKVALEQKSFSHSGIMTLDSLSKAVAFEKQLGKKIVFTNGCFDILHAGHVQYLQEAAALGDRLIVAVNSDASVKRLKGEERPINTVHDRMAVLSSLGAIDWVIDFEEDTPENLLKTLLPDILVKGGDYDIDGVVGGDIIIGHGGKVAVLSLQEGVSTTLIIDSIKASTV